jgi:riboflavin kinase / FMN adenylyltransferase
MTRLFRDLDGSSPCPGGSVVCIGAFDGLHIGHRALVSQTVARARALGVPAVALSFEPLPREFFAGGASPPRLQLPRMKLGELRALGIDHVGLLRFNAALAALSPEDFVQRLLVERLHAREVRVGPDFRFGRARTGNVALLQRMGAEQGFTAETIAPIELDGTPVSSTRIRAALQGGDFATATRLLGKPYSIAGRVVHGKQLGRTLGYPTANLRFANKTPALRGIYATWVHGVTAQPWPSVSSFGTRPTVGGKEPLLEAHLFDFDGDLYGKLIEIEFVVRLRDEEKFPDLPTLVVQMDRDAAQARHILMKTTERATA